MTLESEPITPLVQADRPAALSHLRVLDLSRVLAGPWAAQTLGDLGATVIKVERPGNGDDTRAWGPPFIKDRDGADTRDAAYFAVHQSQQAVDHGGLHAVGRPAHRARAGRHLRRRDRELQARRPERLRPRLRKPVGQQSAAGLLLDHRLRPDRSLRSAARLRLPDPGHGRAHEHHGPAGRRARRPGR